MLLRIIAALLTLAAGSTAAAAGDSQPARFQAGKDSLASRIEFPETRGDGKLRVRCAAKVDEDGDMKDNGCYGDDPGANVFIAAVNNAAKKAQMTPAFIDGKTRAVYVQYQVEFTSKGDNHVTRILNNPGIVENVEAYGDEHIAAQRTLTREPWQKICPQHLRFLVWVKANVAETGVASSVSIARNDGPHITDKCEQSIIATMQASRFSPAFADGEAVPSTFVEPFGN